MKGDINKFFIFVKYKISKNGKKDKHSRDWL